jgi:hypothetical protein
MDKLFRCGTNTNLEEKEKLDPYTLSLSKRSKTWWYFEENTSRENLNYSILNDRSYAKFMKDSAKRGADLRKVEEEEKDRLRPPMNGTFCYDILCNKQYEDYF